MPLKAIFLCLIAIEAYIWFGAMLFYFVEFSSLPKKNKYPQKEINMTALLEGFQHNTSESKQTLRHFAEYVERSLHTEPDPARDPGSAHHPRMTTTEAVITSYTFAGGVISTVGYGNVVPRTSCGKILVIFYAMLGIPLLLAGLAGLGKTMSKKVSSLIHGMFRLLHCSNKPSYKKCAIFKLCFATVLGSVAHIFFASLVYSSLEHWSYLDSVYHSFVTITTIGFGDFVPALSNGDLNYSRGMLVFYIPFRGIINMAGLTWLATMAAMAKELLEETFYGDKFANQRVSEISL